MPFLSNTLVHIRSLTDSHPQSSSTGPAHGHLCGSSSHFHLPRLFSNRFIMSSTILWLTAPADLPLGCRLMSFAHIFMPTSPHLLLLQKRHKAAQPSSLRLLPVQHSGLRQVYNYVLVVCFSYLGTIDYAIISKLNINNRISEVVLQ